MTNAKVLEFVEIFSDLNHEQLNRIFKLCKEVVYIQNEVIFPEYSPSTEFYVIIEGEVAIQFSPDPDSSEEGKQPVTIAVLRKGQSFGEVALVDQGLRSASAICKTMTCKLLVISREDLLQLLNEDLEIGYRVMTNLASDLCFKIRQTNLHLRQSLLYRPSQEG